MPQTPPQPSRTDSTAWTPLRIGEWRVDPRAGQMSRDGESKRLDARTMRLLLCLAERAGTVVSMDELLDHVWSGVIVTPDSVYQAITSLRRLLDDDPKRPAYIATVPRLGYRLVATVEPWMDRPPATAAGDTAAVATQAGPNPRDRAALAVRVLMAMIVLVVGGWMIFSKRSSGAAGHVITAIQQPPSIAVLPFLDMTTQAMTEEYVADGMTEELIDDLSKIPGFRVPGPTSSFYFKDKSLPVTDIAKKLGVAYVVDGSIRKSDGMVRVSTRLIRADDGYVMWTETYDRPEGDILNIQKKLAVQMSASIRAALGKPPATASSAAH